MQREQRRISRRLFRLLELFLFNDERDHAHTRELVARTDGGTAAARGDHHLVLTIHGKKPRAVHSEKTVAGSLELDLTLLDLRTGHVLLPAESEKPFRGVVFMHHVRRHFPDVQMLLAHAQKHGDILRRDNMSLAEAGVLILILDDLRHVVAEHLPYRVLRPNQLHVSAPHFFKAFKFYHPGHRHFKPLVRHYRILLRFCRIILDRE